MTRTVIFALHVSLCLSSLYGEDFSWPHGRRGTSGGGGTDHLDEFSFGIDPTYPAPVVNPDADLRKRLVVEWGKVSMGYIDQDNDLESNDQYWITWKDDDSLREDRMLAIRGRLLIESEDGKSRRPIDWVQGVRVVVSRLPDKKYDWSERQEMHHAVWGDFVIWDKGEFLATVSPGEVLRSVGKESQFQVALSLGERRKQKITCKNTLGVLPQSVTMLSIPGPPPIDETIQIINGAPSYEPYNFNPAKLVRAVNHLRPLGKERAIQELRRFLKMARDSMESTRVDENIDTSDKTCVFLIVRLLFESSDPLVEMPHILTVPFDPIPDDSDKKLWPLHPIHLQDDIPFFMVHSGGLGGAPDQPERHVDWAVEFGKIRERPLRPIDNPMLAAERLWALPQTKRLYAREQFPEYSQDRIFRQAWNIIEDADPQIPKPKPMEPDDDYDLPDYWIARWKSALKLNIKWNEGENKYVLSRP
ncbi:MAG: hypothetical protein WEB58_22990 [Planctomycetaceae bacterium]